MCCTEIILSTIFLSGSYKDTQNCYRKVISETLNLWAAISESISRCICSYLVCKLFKYAWTCLGYSKVQTEVMDITAVVLKRAFSQCLKNDEKSLCFLSLKCSGPPKRKSKGNFSFIQLQHLMVKHNTSHDSTNILWNFFFLLYVSKCNWCKFLSQMLIQ